MSRPRKSLPAAATDRTCRTPGVIASELGVPLHRVTHVLATRDHIRPMGRAGRLRIYSEAAVAQIRYELNLIDAKKAGRSACD